MSDKLARREDSTRASEDVPAVTASVRQMEPADAAAVARLHAETITTGFLSNFGGRFLRQLYLGIASDEGSRVFVVGEPGTVLGFLAYSRDVSAMYRRVLRRRFFQLAFASLPRSLNPLLIKESFDTLRYPAKQTAQKLPPAEILSTGVSAAARGTGIGRLLVEAAVEQARADGQRQLKVLAGAGLEGANRFYSACGFEKTAELIQHGDTLNVYVKSLADQ